MVVTPQTLWREFDRRLLPLEPTIVGERQYLDGIERLVYFNADSAGHSYVRVFARLLLPSNYTDKTGAVIIMPDSGTSVMDLDADYLLKKNCAAFIVDYAGDYQERERYTIYPKRLSHCNFNPETAFTDFEENPRNSCWFSYALIAFRAVTYLESIGLSKFAAVGMAEGGAQIWKLLSFENTILCGAALFPSGLETEETDDKKNSFKAALNTISYAPLLIKPIMVVTASNDIASTFKQEMEIFESIIRPDCALMVEPCSNRLLTPRQLCTLELFITDFLNGNNNFPLMPQIETRVINHTLSYAVKPSGNPDSIILHLSNSFVPSHLRNWSALKAIISDSSEYIFTPKIYLPKAEAYAFAKLNYGNISICSPVSCKLPALIGVNPSPLVKKRLVYDCDMGTADFSSTDSKGFLTIENGPYNISGISVSKGILSTFKLGDVAYSGENNSILQIILHSFINQKLNFRITDIKGHTFFTTASVSPNDDWLKLTFSASDFKSEEGALGKWENAVLFEIETSGKLLLSSILWV